LNDGTAQPFVEGILKGAALKIAARFEQGEIRRLIEVGLDIIDQIRDCPESPFRQLAQPSSTITVSRSSLRKVAQSVLKQPGCQSSFALIFLIALLLQCPLGNISQSDLETGGSRSSLR